jgi:hypothetical protein
MAMSTCVKCGGSFFELAEAEPHGSEIKVYFVQCSSCGGVVGIMDYYNTALTIDKLAKKLGVRNLLGS